MSGPLLDLLAVAGAVALVSRFLGAVGRWLLKAAEVAVARGRVDVHARGGDLTGLEESRETVARERRALRINAALVGLLLLCLVLPLAIGPLEAYALASPLWLVPRRAAWAGARRGASGPRA